MVALLLPSLVILPANVGLIPALVTNAQLFTLLGGTLDGVLLAFALAVLLPLAGKELAKPDWDLEWLVTMPIERSTLLWGRLVERSASNLSGMFALFPAWLMVAWYSGFRWSAIPVAVLVTALLMPLAALLHTLIDTGMRLWLAASQLRNLQAVLSLLNAPLIYLVLALGTPGGSHTPHAGALRTQSSTKVLAPGMPRASTR